MRRLRLQMRLVFALLVLAPAGAAFAVPAVAAPQQPGVFGRVTGEVAPLAAVRVYAYQLADFSLQRVVTNAEGRFRFPELPAGLYKIIAFKTGFVPVIVMLTHSREDAQQFLELQLAQDAAENARASDDFWSIRGRIPADVLREIETPEGSGVKLADSPFTPDPARSSNPSSASFQTSTFATKMEAMTGYEQLPVVGEALLAGGQVGVEGSMGDLRVGLTGDFWRLGPTDAYADAGAGGQSREIALRLQGADAKVDLATSSHRLVGADEEPVDFETHRLSWSQSLSDHSRAHLAAQYTSQTNYYSQSPLAPLEIPRDSRSWEVDSSYTLDPSTRTSFQGGFRYRDREVGVAGSDAFGPNDPTLHDERLDLFGRSGFRLRPTVLVEYGLYTTLRDGTMSLTPHGGLVVQLGDRWQASTLASGKVSTVAESSLRRDFVPAFYHESSACTQGEQSCYQVELSRRSDDGENSLSVGAVDRQIGETLRLFFNDDFFDHLESLYLVQGDQLPEVQLGVTRRITPKLIARLESNAGSGGGGIFYATDQAPYQNSVRYLVTSLDTHYQGTDTGLFISFRHLEQDLQPLGGAAATGGQPPRLEIERLQLMLTQDLNILLDLASDWAVKLNMEISRGSTLFGPGSGKGDELRSRVLGGFAVRF